MLLTDSGQLRRTLGKLMSLRLVSHACDIMEWQRCEEVRLRREMARASPPPAAHLDACLYCLPKVHGKSESTLFCTPSLHITQTFSKFLLIFS